jgi:Cdc6-like AAA superfamily ATPase
VSGPVKLQVGGQNLWNDEDAELMFSRADLEPRLERIVRRAFRTQVPPKMVLWGDWGVGKTHTLRHLIWSIEANPDYNAKCVFVELPDFSKKSDFSAAHAAILDAIGLDQARDWVLRYQASKGGSAEDALHDFTTSADIASAFMTLPIRGDISRIAWDWLRGVKLAAGEARTAGLPPVLHQSQSMASAVRLLGKLSRELDDQMLIVFLDEADKLRAIEDPDAVSHWLNAMRILSDPLTKEIGLIVAASFRDRNEFPPPLTDGQVLSRIGESNYIELPTFTEDDAAEFVCALFESFIDPGKRTNLIAAHQAEADSETLDCFPLTGLAIRRFSDFVCRHGGLTTPRDVQRVLDEFLNEAIDANRHVLSSTFIEDVIATYG